MVLRWHAVARLVPSRPHLACPAFSPGSLLVRLQATPTPGSHHTDIFCCVRQTCSTHSLLSDFDNTNPMQPIYTCVENWKIREVLCASFALVAWLHQEFQWSSCWSRFGSCCWLTLFDSFCWFLHSATSVMNARNIGASWMITFSMKRLTISIHWLQHVNG